MGENYNRLKIKDLPVEERPYERMLRYGPEVLSDAEIIAILIRTGTRKETSVELARRVLIGDDSYKGLSFLYEVSIDELKSIKGIGDVKAVQIKAAVELTKRMSKCTLNKGGYTIKCPDDVSRMVMEDMRALKQENLRVLMLDAKNRVLGQRNVFTGSLTTSIVHPREIFSDAIRKRCAGIVVIHNHPSGDPTPSDEDINATRRIAEAGSILGINLIDHIVIGDGRFISLKESGMM